MLTHEYSPHKKFPETSSSKPNWSKRLLTNGMQFVSRKLPASG
jgi:hypothetical protein